MPALARQSLLFVHCLLAAVWLPQLLDALLGARQVRSVALYSPVRQEFLFKEFVPAWQAGALTAQAQALLEHGLLHVDQTGRPLSRIAFENALPFLYAENMAVRSLTPVSAGGRSFDLEALRAGKLVLGVRPANLAGARLDPGLHALLESRPERAGLVFPEERFRLENGLTFLNADTNAPDAALSAWCNSALAGAGARFPLRAAFGNDTVLKPRDAGWFLLDAQGGLFRLRRVRGEPEAARVPLPEGVEVLHVQVQESRDASAVGLLVSAGGGVFLLREDLTLRPMPCAGYDPALHAVKVVVDPLFESCILDSGHRVEGLARPADRQDAPPATAGRPAPSFQDGPAEVLSRLLCPLRLDLTREDTEFVQPALSFGGWWSLAGMALWGLAWLVLARLSGRACSGALWAALGGAAGFAAAWAWSPRRHDMD